MSRFLDDLVLKVAQIENTAFVKNCAETAYAKYIERIGKKPAPMVADFYEAISRNQVEIIEFKDANAGFVISYPQREALFIENIALSPRFQGCGLAGKTFKLLEAKALANNLSTIELYTNQAMSENLGLYSHLGFLEYDRREENGFNRVYFRKILEKKGI